MMPRLPKKIPRSHRSRKPATTEYALHLRNNMTRAETFLWERLKKRQRIWRHKFEPQQVVFGYIPDFYCTTLKLAVEIDGRVHDRKDVKRNDKLRTRRLKKQGVTVIRFRNSMVFNRPHLLLNLLEQVCLDGIPDCEG